jgi:hypothetical protein
VKKNEIVVACGEERIGAYKALVGKPEGMIWMVRPYTGPTQQLSGPPPIYKLRKPRAAT